MTEVRVNNSLEIIELITKIETQLKTTSQPKNLNNTKEKANARTKWCSYHEVFSHNTNDCLKLKKQR